jgi:hypothetical protein
MVGTASWLHLWPDSPGFVQVTLKSNRRVLANFQKNCQIPEIVRPVENMDSELTPTLRKLLANKFKSCQYYAVKKFLIRYNLQGGKFDS